MRPVGQGAQVSSHFGRYGLGDSDESLYESTTSVNRQRLTGVIAMKVSKGLEFPVVALPGAAQVFYVATTRATQRLVIGGWGFWGEVGTVSQSKVGQ